MDKHQTPRGDRFLRLPAVLDEVGLKRSQVYDMIKAGEFPAPYQLSKRAVAWRESEVHAWKASRQIAPHFAEAL
jgi:prophage regulatory protein